MSYVRFSTPIKIPEGVDALEYYSNAHRFCVPTSDFYIYFHVDGYVAVHLAGNRHSPTVPFEGATTIGAGTPDEPRKTNPEYWKWLEDRREAIDHPDAGKTFSFEDLNEAAAAVERWISEGFLAPPWLVDHLRGGPGEED